MATATSQTKLSGLARTLIQEKLLSEDEARAIEEQAHTTKSPFISQLIQSKKLSSLAIAEVSAKAFGFPYFNLDAFNTDYLPAKKIDAKLMQTNRVLALQARNNTLFVAISDPTNIHALDSVQFQMGMNISPIVVEDDKLGRWIDKIIESSDTSLKSIDVDDDDFVDGRTLQQGKGGR